VVENERLWFSASLNCLDNCPIDLGLEDYVMLASCHCDLFYINRTNLIDLNSNQIALAPVYMSLNGGGNHTVWTGAGTWRFEVTENL